MDDKSNGTISSFVLADWHGVSCSIFIRSHIYATVVDYGDWFLLLHHLHRKNNQSWLGTVSIPKPLHLKKCIGRVVHFCTCFEKPDREKRLRRLWGARQWGWVGVRVIGVCLRSLGSVQSCCDQAREAMPNRRRNHAVWGLMHNGWAVMEMGNRGHKKIWSNSIRMHDVIDEWNGGERNSRTLLGQWWLLFGF